MKTETSWQERFWAKVDRRGPEECWPWLAYRTPDGYGTFNTQLPGLTRFAHRLAYLLVRGELPSFDHRSCELDHLCRNPSCVNPDHLEPVSHRENVRRSPIHFASVNIAKTHCIHGHPLEGTNLILVPRGRQCRACADERRRRFYARHGGEAAYARAQRAEKKGSTP